MPAALEEVVCAQDRPITLIIGEGFDPRMLDSLTLLNTVQHAPIQVFCLRIGRSSNDSKDALKVQVETNRAALAALAVPPTTLTLVDTQFEEDDRNSTAPASSDKAIDFARQLELLPGSTVVVDISALPQGIYFPILEVFIGQRRPDFDSKMASLFVFVSENAALDAQIAPLELQEDAYLVPPFRSALAGTEDTRPIIWFPVLGTGEQEQLDRIQKLLPTRVELEICPVLPMPSTDPRRADGLLREYESTLQDTWSVDARSLIYAAEQNPFHLYTQITRAVDRYEAALRPIGGCRAVISSHSSKVLSMGALLAASELNSQDFDVGLANVDATRYRLDLGPGQAVTSTYVLIPLLGDVYNA